MTTGTVAAPLRQMTPAPMQPLAASVICPVYNNLELTMDFVFNMLEHVKSPHEIVVVANGCTDPTPAFLAQMARSGHNVRTVISKENRGFGGGNNLGAREAANPIHVFLSNDVRAGGDFLTPIMDTLLDEPTAVVGARIHHHDTGWNTFVCDRTIDQGRIYAVKGQPLTIPYVEGWCLAVDSRYCHRNKPADKTQVGGLWDERYSPCDYEDVDVSMQAMLENHSLINIVQLPVRHEHTGQTANRIAGGRLAVTLRNRQKFMEKWGLSLPIKQ